MIRDLRTILDGWSYEPGKISVRKIIGRDGREKLQTRVDLGVLQLECTGRPDGLRPHGCESLLEFHDQRLRELTETQGSDEDFVLSPEDCRELRHEAYLYYQRYLSLFVLEEFDGVIRDTARNLRLIDLSERYAAREADRELLRPQRAYVMMMMTRARAQAALATSGHAAAIQALDEGIAEISRTCPAIPGTPAPDEELRALRAMRRSFLEALPEDAPERLKSELAVAVATEDYERAAELRDRLQGQRGTAAARRPPSKSPTSR